MKKFLLKSHALLICALFATPTAFAMHAYGTDNCSAMTISGHELRISQDSDKLASPHRITPESADSQDENVRFESTLRILAKGPLLGESDIEASEANLVLKTLLSRTLHSRKIDDGCFVGKAKVTKRIVRISSLSTEIVQKYSLKRGQKLELNCYSDFSEPTGPKCGVQ